MFCIKINPSIIFAKGGSVRLSSAKRSRLGPESKCNITGKKNQSDFSN